MYLDATEKLDKMYANRYEAVILAAKHTRRLNLERLREKTEGEEAVPKEKPLKVVIQALKDVLEEKVKFERIEKT
ncbi:MAG: DNA-directed RNA polymerase subunit omega [candidate division Zixibacteria bacterium]|nr:DNA-directed RNA polymerase subunit omega [candidate division Zixibacteria bacterium]